MLHVAKIVPQTSAEGPFERCALWVSGCDLACPGCCNAELFDPASGRAMSQASVGDVLDRAVASGLEGITVLGGEPLQQMGGVSWLLREAQRRGLGTLVFTGYTLAQAQTRPGFSPLWQHVDTLIDGRFELQHREPARRFIGSSNQRLHHRTDRYADPSLWAGGARIEVRIGPGGLVEGHGLPGPLYRLRRAMK